MTPSLSDCRRTAREAIADEAYCRLRALLESEPALFLATRDGLAVSSDDLDARILRAGCEDALARSVVSHAAQVDGWLLRATSRFWLLHPEAFECGEDLPSGVRDHRWDSVATCWDRESHMAGGNAAFSQLDAW